jgi:hypothetical protein
LAAIANVEENPGTMGDSRTRRAQKNRRDGVVAIVVGTWVRAVELLLLNCP